MNGPAIDDTPEAADEEPESRLGRISASLRVSGSDLDPAEITRLLGVEPHFGARKGDERLSGSRTITQRIGMWSLSVEHDPAADWDLEGAIVDLLGRIPTDVAMWQTIGGRYKVDMFCGLFMGVDNQGCLLSAATMRALSERGILLDLDVYGPPS